MSNDHTDPTDHKEPSDVRNVWQAEGAGAIGMSGSDLRARIDLLARQTRRRTIGGLVVCGLVLVSCIWWLTLLSDPLSRVGILLTAAGIGALAWQLFAGREGEQAARRRAAAMGGTPSVDFHRSELERQRDFHRGWRLWSRLLVFVPGPPLLFAGFARAHPEVAGTIRLEAIAAALLLLAAIPVNRWLGRRYQHQLDELNTLRKDRP
jgi:hypothetical protein